MPPKIITVVGSGFAGLWSALGAARKLDELGVPSSDVTIEVINRDPYHSIRDCRALLDAAAPIVQTAPANYCS